MPSNGTDAPGSTAASDTAQVTDATRVTDRTVGEGTEPDASGGDDKITWWIFLVGVPLLVTAIVTVARSGRRKRKVPGR